MIVRMTAYQYATLKGNLDVRLRWWFEKEVEVTPVGKTKVDVDTIPDVWLMALEQATQVLMRPRANAALLAAASRVSRKINHLRTHPAYEQIALLGSHYEVLPCWYIELPGIEERWPFYPNEEAQFTLLWPIVKAYGGTRITTWYRLDSTEAVVEAEPYERFRSVMS